MDRRKFLRNSSVAGVSLTALASGIAINKAGAQQLNAAAGWHNDEFVLNEATIDTLQQKMKSGEYTSRSITEMYLKRIEAIDKNGPAINAVIEINPDALAIADAMDKERKAGKLRGPMHGIPILIKDNIDTGDKMMTTAGALALAGNIAKQDAHIVKLLRDAGAVIIGKTNLSEWANFRSTRSTSGWSSRGGQTKNPNVLDRNPCGSSSGSGAAVSANLCTVAVGTETNGSVVCPSAFCGIVGIKPTVGLLSRSGIIPISATQDTAGPMARTVKDAAILLAAMSGVNDNDPVTKQSEGKTQKDYTAGLNINALQGKRIGVEKAHMQGHEAVVAQYRQAIEMLKQKGAEIIEIELLEKTKELGEAEFKVLQYEFKDGVNKYLANANAKVKTIADVIAFNSANEASAMPYFKQEILESSNKLGDLGTAEYQESVKKSTSARSIIDTLMKEQRLDAICGVTMGPACCTDLVSGDYDTGFYFSSPAAMAGYPHITVPMGQVFGLPVGFSFISTAYKEQDIINFAYAYEQATLARKAPAFLPQVG